MSTWRKSLSIFLALSFFAPVASFADRIGVLVEEEDGSNPGFAVKLKFPSGSLSNVGGVTTVSNFGMLIREEWQFANAAARDAYIAAHPGEIKDGNYVSVGGITEIVGPMNVGTVLTAQRIRSDPNKFDTAYTLKEDFGTIGDWSIGGGVGGAIAADTTYKRVGAGSLKVIPGVGTFCAVDKTVSLSLTGRAKLWVYLPALTGLASIDVFAASVAWTKYLKKSFNVNFLHTGWNCLNIAPSEWEITGGAAVSDTVVKLRVRVNASVGGQPTVYFDAYYDGGYDRPKCVIMFDDGYKGVYDNAFSYMQSLGFRGTCYLIASTLDGVDTAYMKPGHVAELYDAGWDLCPHGGTDLTGMESDEVRTADIVANRKWLIDRGYTRNNSHLHYAYPVGAYSAGILTILDTLGFVSARCVAERLQFNTLSEKYLLSWECMAQTTPVATATGWIDMAIAQGSTLMLTNHNIVETPTVATEVSIANFRAVMDYLKVKSDAGLIDVITITEWFSESKRF